ncbi:MAG: hypothetical protein Q3W81_04590, partial [Slackia sp.]|nr:hypothetical protein [Slackia sp.]
VAGHGCDAFLGTFYAWSLKIIPMADDHVFSFLDVFSFQFAKEILRYPISSGNNPIIERRSKHDDFGVQTTSSRMWQLAT